MIQALLRQGRMNENSPALYAMAEGEFKHGGWSGKTERARGAPGQMAALARIGEVEGTYRLKRPVIDSSLSPTARH